MECLVQAIKRLEIQAPPQEERNGIQIPGARLAHHRQPTQSELLLIVRQPLRLKLSKIRSRHTERSGIGDAVANLNFESIRATAIVPNCWHHTTIKDVHMHLGKPTGTPEPTHRRLSRHELLPLHGQGLNFLAWRSRCDQNRHVEIAARDSSAT